jgi:hypothetical protein
MFIVVRTSVCTFLLIDNFFQKRKDFNIGEVRLPHVVYFI